MLPKYDRSLSFLLIGLVLALNIVSCRPAPEPGQPFSEPDVYAEGTRVTLTVRFPTSKHELGPRSSQLFLEMLKEQPIHTEISQMPAAPLGIFTVEGVDYLWHGNAVIRGHDREERLWHGPFLQRLIIAKTEEQPFGQDAMQKLLDELENDPTVAETPLEGPGAYPGGGDALHPTILVVPKD